MRGVLGAIFVSSAVVIAIPNDASAARMCLQPETTPVFCADTSGYTDSIELVSCPEWGPIGPDWRCSAAWDVRDLTCCSTVYRNVPKKVPCGIVDVRRDGAAGTRVAQCAVGAKQPRVHEPTSAKSAK